MRLTPGDKRFIEVVETLLKLEPDKAPGPTKINEMMGRIHRKQNQINGRENALRHRVLEEHGFAKDPWTGRWVKK